MHKRTSYERNLPKDELNAVKRALESNFLHKKTFYTSQRKGMTNLNTHLITIAAACTFLTKSSSFLCTFYY
ncbi:hypothetical protein Hanom_Chr07g00660811 [Helianthus anomalus]